MVFKSTFEDVVAPTEYKDCLSFFIWHQLDVFADKTLFVDYESGREWTGKQIKEEATKIAKYLIIELGLKPGQGCVLFGINNDYMLLLSVAVMFAGGFVCAGEPSDPRAEHEHMIASVDPAIVFIDSHLYKELDEICASRVSSGLRNYKICILDDEVSKFSIAGVLGLHTHIRRLNGIQDSEGIELPVLVNPDTPVYILLTSGSTGKPKPVARTQRNSLYTCLAIKHCPQLWKLDDTCVMAGHLQLDHGTGLFCIKTTLTLGSKLIIMKYYVQSQMLDAIEKYRITEIMLGSAYLQNFIVSQEIQGRDLSSLRNFFPVGSPLASHSDAVTFMKNYPNVVIRQAYGLTEFGFVSFVPAKQAQTEKKSVGLLLPNVLVKLLDMSTGEEINEPNKLGELYLSGPTLCNGYLGTHLADQTKAAFLDDGYYRTCDMAMIDDRQHLCVRGRINDVLCISDGWKVLPSEIEELISGHPQVKEVAIIGIPHPNLPTCHAIRAFVVLKEPGKLSEQDLIKWVAERSSEPKHLNGGVKFMDSLPRITLAKVDKKALRAIQF